MSDVVFPMCVKMPVRCLTDNGPEFRGSEFVNMLARHGIKHSTISPWMSHCNGLVERTVKTFTDLLRMCCESPYDWDLYVAKMLWVYNSTIHSAVGMSPRNYLFECE